jgi:hypothetical protein
VEKRTGASVDEERAPRTQDCRRRTVAPGCHCAGKNVVNGHASYCLSIGGVQIDDAVVRAVLAALEPLGLEAELAAAKKLFKRFAATLRLSS